MPLRLFNDSDLTKHLSEDIRGFIVFAADNTRIGEIEQLWIDPERRTIQFATARVHPKSKVREDKVHFHYNHLRVIGRAMVKTDKQLNDILKLSSRIKLPPKDGDAVAADTPRPVQPDTAPPGVQEDAPLSVVAAEPNPASEPDSIVPEEPQADLPSDDLGAPIEPGITDPS